MRLKIVHIWSVGVLVVCALCICSAVRALSEGAPGFEIQDVGVNTTVSFHPVYLEGSDESMPEIVAASRVRIRGWSRLQHADKFYHTFRVKIVVPSYRSLSADSKVNVCWDQDPSWTLGECRNGSWRTVDNGGSWTFSMSPFQEKYLDVRVSKSFTAPSVTISVQDENSTFRLVFLAMGVMLVVMAPVVCAWVPFYYGSAMTLGVLTVAIFLLYQGMKLFPTGRKSTLYIVMMGSLAGFGSMLVSYFKGIVSLFLQEMGVSDDIYSPVAIFALAGIAMLGAYLGYLCVRKLVITENGIIDEGIALFVLWAMRIMGGLALSQSSSDVVFRIFTLIGGLGISWVLLNVRVSLFDVWENLQDYWFIWVSKPVEVEMPKRDRKPVISQAQIDALRRLPGTGALIMGNGLLNSPSEGSNPGTMKKRIVKTGELYPSSFHKSPGYKPPSKQEFEERSRELSSKCVEELVNTKEWVQWREANRYRCYIEPYESRQERPEEEIELTASLEEAKLASGGFFTRKRK